MFCCLSYKNLFKYITFNILMQTHRLYARNCRDGQLKNYAQSLQEYFYELSLYNCCLFPTVTQIFLYVLFFYFYNLFLCPWLLGGFSDGPLLPPPSRDLQGHCDRILICYLIYVIFMCKNRLSLKYFDEGWWPWELSNIQQLFINFIS